MKQPWGRTAIREENTIPVRTDRKTIDAVCVGRKLVRFIDIKPQSNADLPEVALARGGTGGCFRPPQRGEQQSRKNCDDRDHNEQFDQGKTTPPELGQPCPWSLSLRSPLADKAVSAPTD